MGMTCHHKHDTPAAYMRHAKQWCRPGMVIIPDAATGKACIWLLHTTHRILAAWVAYIVWLHMQSFLNVCSAGISLYVGVFLRAKAVWG